MYRLYQRHFSKSSNRSSPTYSNSLKLSEEQNCAFDQALKGNNIFITGSVGTGKTFLIKRIAQQLESRYGSSVAVTAGTSLAALNVKGTTLDMFSGVTSKKRYLKLPPVNRKYIQRWLHTKVLLIDEVSTLDASYFDTLCLLAQEARNSPKPFGGIQVIASGDFFHLPSIPSNPASRAKFTFEAKEWGNTFTQNQVQLTRNFWPLQPQMARMLADVRLGELSEASRKLLGSLEKPVDSKDGIEPVELFPLQVLADQVNTRRLQDLNGKSEIYRAQDNIRDPAARITNQRERRRERVFLVAPDTVELKVDAQVICTQTILPGKIERGSLGRVIQFMNLRDSQDLPYPIQYISSPSARDVHSKLRYILKVTNVLKKYPVVQFENGLRVLVTPTLFTTQEHNPEADIAQIPLELAWALHVHKVNNRSLSRMKIDLAGRFPPGLAYVGLSRCRSLEGLQVLNFSPDAVTAPSKVSDWYKKQRWASAGAERQGRAEP